MDTSKTLATIENGSSQQIQIRATNYKGIEYIDIRKFYLEIHSNSYKPTKKGISLTPDQWGKLLKVLETQI